MGAKREIGSGRRLRRGGRGPSGNLPGETVRLTVDEILEDSNKEETRDLVQLITIWR